MLIPLTQGVFAKVDKSDFDQLSVYKWQAAKGRQGELRAVRTVYDKKSGKRKTVQMSRQILQAVGKQKVDHKNGNTLDNSRKNLRACSNQENGYNRGKNKNNSSGFRGVSYEKRCGKWRATLKAGGAFKSLGYFESKKMAILSWKAAAKVYFGEYVRLD